MIAKRTVLVVDNEAGTRESLRWMLKANYQVRVAENPLTALNMMQQEPMDMVLSDILMEPFDGIALLQKIKAKDKAMPVVMMTAFANHQTVLGAMRAGALDYLIKPFDVKQVEDTVQKALAQRDQDMLEKRVLNDMTKTVEQQFKGSVDSLMQALGAKDIYTFAHSKRVAVVFKRFAKRHGFRDSELELYQTMAGLHDIGKIGVRDSVLKKPGALTPEEYEEIKLHPKMGYHIVKHLDLSDESVDIVIHHQERYDGNGYPHKLAGNKIPLASRLFAVVDSYDAMRGPRPYRQEGLSHETTMQEIKRNAGTQFDPALVHDFDKMWREGATA